MANNNERRTNVCIRLCEKRKLCENIYNAAKSNKKKTIKNIRQHTVSASAVEEIDARARIIRILCYSTNEHSV